MGPNTHCWHEMQTEIPSEGVSDVEEVPEITHWEAIVWLAILTAWISFL